jgi:hypothetical protein
VAETPGTLDGHIMVVFNNSLWVFGGFGATYVNASALWRFSLDTSTWSDLSAQIPTAALTGRAYASAVVMAKDTMVVLSGTLVREDGVQETQANMLAINLTSFATQVYTIGGVGQPSARALAAVAATATTLYAAGGYELACSQMPCPSSILLSDAWRWDMTTAQWSPLPNLPYALFGAGSALYQPTSNGPVYWVVFGGNRSPNNYLGTFFSSDLLALPLQSASTWLNWTVPGAPSPGPVFSPILVSIGARSQLVLLSGQLPNTVRLTIANTMWLFNGAGGWQRLDVAGTPALVYSAVSSLGPTSPTLVLHGGTDSDSNAFGTLYTLTLACQAGSASIAFPTIPCLTCAAGSYSSVGTSTCVPCPPLTTTTVAGATDAKNCNVCLPNACSGHGTCEIFVGRAAACRCDVGFAGKTCSNYAFIVVFALVPIAVLMVVGIVLLAVRFYKRVRVFKQDHELNQVCWTFACVPFVLLLTPGVFTDHRQMLLSESRRELAQLERVWAIDENDIDFSEIIGQGSFGVVSLLTTAALAVDLRVSYCRSSVAVGTGWMLQSSACAWHLRST